MADNQTAELILLEAEYGRLTFQLKIISNRIAELERYFLRKQPESQQPKPAE